MSNETLKNLSKIDEKQLSSIIGQWFDENKINFSPQFWFSNPVGKMLKQKLLEVNRWKVTRKQKFNRGHYKKKSIKPRLDLEPVPVKNTEIKQVKNTSSNFKTKDGCLIPKNKDCTIAELLAANEAMLNKMNPNKDKFDLLVEKVESDLGIF